MFTGIITDTGRVLELERRGDTRARIATGFDVATIPLGASIACDGVCLTVIATGEAPEPWFDVQFSAETRARTNLDRWEPGRRINLERSLRVGDELGGHIVSGHVDGTGELVRMQDEGDSTRMTFEVRPELARYIAPKGSIALNGTSLTVNQVEGARFGVNLIPHTKQVTTWGDAREGDAVNVEIDTIARYVARLREWE